MALVFVPRPPLQLRAGRRSASGGGGAGRAVCRGDDGRSLGVVVTGGSRGVGRALADRLLAAGDAVLFCARHERAVRRTEATLRARHPAARVRGCVADVSRAADVQRLADEAAAWLPRVDVLLCAAATTGSRAAVADASPDALAAAVGTNLLGALLCARAAARLAASAPPPAPRRALHVFLVDGSGTLGGATPGYAAYGATKRAVPQLVASLNREQQQQARGVVRFHVVSPGMVLTELLLGGARAVDARALGVFNVLAEEPGTVAAALAPRLRRVVLRDGAPCYVRFLTPLGAARRVALRVLFGVRRRRFFDARTGLRVDQHSGKYTASGVRIDLD